MFVLTLCLKLKTPRVTNNITINFLSLSLTSVLPLIEDLEVHDSGESANNQLIALGTSF